MRTGNQSIMGEPIHFEEGAPPWAPSQISKNVLTLNFWNMPTSGVISQGGTLYQYRCLAGTADEWSLWLYREIPSEFLPAMMAGSDPSWLDPLPAASAAALAHVAEGIVHFHQLDSPGLLNESLADLMDERDVPKDVRDQMWEEINAAA